jgi:hypothetical protein
MILWLRLRRVEVLVAAISALAVALQVAGERHVIIPTVIGGGSSMMSWSVLMPLAWAAALCSSFESTAGQVESRANPRVGRLDCLLFTASTVAVTGTFIFTATASAGGKALISAHLLVLAGLAVSGTALFGAGVGALLATSLVLATCSYSPSMPGARFVRVLQPDGEPLWSLAVGITLCMGALVLLVTGRRGAGSRHL